MDNVDIANKIIRINRASWIINTVTVNNSCTLAEVKIKPNGYISDVQDIINKLKKYGIEYLSFDFVTCVLLLSVPPKLTM